MFIIFDILGGFEVTEDELTAIYTTAKQYSTDKLPELGNGQPDGASSEVFGSGIVSYLATGNYNYDNKYYLSASFVGMVLPAWEPIIAGRISGPYLAHGASVARISLKTMNCSLI